MRAFLFNLSLPKLEHDGDPAEDEYDDASKVLATLGSFHPAQRCNVLPVILKSLDEIKYKGSTQTKKKVMISGLNMRALRIPELTLIANYLIQRHKITCKNDLATMVHKTLKQLKDIAADIIESPDKQCDISCKYLFDICFWANGYDGVLPDGSIWRTMKGKVEFEAVNISKDLNYHKKNVTVTINRLDH